MGLQRKRRTIRPGVPEGVAALLLGITLLAGVLWWISADKADWRLTSATLVASSYAKDSRLLDMMRTPVELSYEYVIDGKVYRGKTTLGLFQRVMFRFMPERVSTPSPPQGYVGLEDMPREIRELLESKGVVSLDKVPDSFLDALRAKGYTAVKDMPQEFKDALKKEDYGAVARMLDETLPAGTPAPPPEERPPAGIAANLPESLASAEEGNLHVWYDPDNPQRNMLDLLPATRMIPSIAPFVLGALISVLYCAWGYPWLKHLRSA